VSETTVFRNFITANLTATGATIRQITDAKVSAEINLDPEQVKFVLAQLGGAA
jgi:hypothetical protein